MRRERYSLEALDVALETLHAAVLPAEVDGDADVAGVLLGDAGGSEFVEGESASSPSLGVVARGGAVDDGAQESLDGPRRDGGGFGDAGEATATLAHGLVEPGRHVPLPVLVEMRVGHHLRSLGRHGCGLLCSSLFWRLPLAHSSSNQIRHFSLLRERSNTPSMFS